MTETAENWKPVVGYEDCYAVSDLGRVARVSTWGGKPKWKVIAPRVGRGGYVKYHLCKDGVRKDPLGHRIVWAAFRGEIPEGLELNHISSVRTDNRLSNLEMVTRSANARHSYTHNGRISPLAGRHGERATRVKLTEAKVIEIRAAAAAGTMLKDLAMTYGVTATNIGNIVARKKWRHI